MKHEGTPQKEELPEEYSAEWLVTMLEQRLQESVSRMEERKTENPKEAEFVQGMIDERLNAPEGWWTYRVFANLGHQLHNRDWLIWGTDKERRESLKNMPGSDEVREREVQKWKDLRVTLEKLNLSKEKMHQFHFQHPLSPEEIDVLGRVYFEMSKLGYGEDELQILG